MHSELHPVRGRIVVRPDPKSQKSAGGILLPGRSDDEFDIGTVLAVGPGVYQAGTLIPNCCAVGERVLFVANAGSPITYKDDVCVIMDDSDIVAILH